MTKVANREYLKKRMATVVAEHTSGVQGAIPEQDDFDTAMKILNALDEQPEDESRTFYNVFNEGKEPT